MSDLTLGNISLTRVVESDDPHLVPTAVFPDWSEDAVAPHRGWMEPRHLNDKGHLVVVIQSFLIRTPHHTILVDLMRRQRQGAARFAFPSPAMELARYAGGGGRTARRRRFRPVHPYACRPCRLEHETLENGHWVPTFPNARYIFAKKEWEHWQQLATETQLPRTGNYIADSVLPIVEAGRADLVESDHEIETGIWLEPLPGHSPGLVGVNLSSGGGRAILCGDLMHHKIQCHFPDWSTNFCTDQSAARTMRRSFLDRHAETDTLVYPAHFPAPTGGRIERAPADVGGEFTFTFLGE